MATQSLAPDAILVQTNLSGGLAAIQDDPDLVVGTDTSWLEATSDGANVDLRVSFPTPSGNLAVGATQTLKWKVRKSAALGNAGTTNLELWEAGVSKVVGPGVVVVDDVGVVLTLTFTDADLVDKTGAGVEGRVICTAPGGKPGDKRVIDVAAGEWDCQYEPWPPPDAVWPPPSIDVDRLEASSLDILEDLLVSRYGFTIGTPTTDEQTRFDASLCSEGHSVTGIVWVAPNGDRFLKAFCTDAVHKEALTLWAPYTWGTNSGVV